MYQPGYRPTTSDNGEDTEDNSVDLVQLHREHCPWRNAETQRASGSLTGLNASEILHRVVSTYARDQRRRSQEQRSAGDVENVPPPSEDEAEVEHQALSRDEVARQDKERESRLRKIKNMFSIRRRPKAAVK